MTARFGPVVAYSSWLHGCLPWIELTVTTESGAQC